MLGQPNFRLVPRFPAPETLGLFRVGNEEDDVSGSDSGSESGSEEEDDASRQSPQPSAGEAQSEGVPVVDEADGDDHDAMDTDPSPQNAIVAPTESAPPPAVNGVKRSLEEDDDYDAE